MMQLENLSYKKDLTEKKKPCRRTFGKEKKNVQGKYLVTLGELCVVFGLISQLRVKICIRERSIK